MGKGGDSSTLHPHPLSHLFPLPITLIVIRLAIQYNYYVDKIFGALLVMSE